jgi:ribosomal protein S18 acetylase RimI-like enzyme
MIDFTIRPIQDSDRDWVRQFMIDHWGAEIVVAHGTIYRPHELSGFIAFRRRKPIGLVTYQINDRACEIVTLDSLQARQGIGTALIEAVKAASKQSGCTRLWLITTNDNLNALRFYQKRGFELVAIHRRAIEQSRQIKPQIPLIGEYGIPLRDEIELEYDLLQKSI